MVHTTERDPARRALIEDAVGRGPARCPSGRSGRGPQPVLAVPDAGRSRIVAARAWPRGWAWARCWSSAWPTPRSTGRGRGRLLFLSWAAAAARPRRRPAPGPGLLRPGATALSEARLRESRERALGVAGRAQRLGQPGHLGLGRRGRAGGVLGRGLSHHGLAPGEEMTLERYLESSWIPPIWRPAIGLRAELLAGRRDELRSCTSA